MRNKLICTCVLALGLALGPAGAANAAVTLGSTTLGTSTSSCFSSDVLTEATSDPSTPYAVPAGGGEITQWATRMTAGNELAPLTFVVLRPSGGSYTVIGVDSVTLPASVPTGGVASFTLSTPIAVEGGDTLGLYTGASTAAICYSDGGSTPTGDSVVSLGEASPPANGQSLSVVAPGQSPGGYTIDVSATLAVSQDAAVTTSTAPAKPTVGNLAVLASTVTNDGPGALSITFRDTVPSGLTIDFASTGSGNCTVSGQLVTCTVTGLAAGGSAPVNVVVTPQAKGSYTNNVGVGVAVGVTDPNPANNSASATLKVGLKPTPAACVVAKLKGTPAGVAKHVLKLLGCKVKVKRIHHPGVGKGLAIKTKPGAGTYAFGKRVTLLVSK